MKVSANDIKTGNVVEYNNKLCIVTKTQHVQPGKGGAYIQAELKSLDGNKFVNRFRSSEMVERVFLEESDGQFLYQEGDQLVFMNQETFEQVVVGQDIIGDAISFLSDGMVVKLCSHNGNVISASLPQTVVLEIRETEPVVKGQTAASSYKPAILENGVKVMVPQHVDQGTRVVINTSDHSYVEKAK